MSDEVNAREFFEMAMRPECGNKMVFELKRTSDDGLYFSVEAYADMALQIQRFLMARHVAETERVGHTPTEMHVRVQVGWWLDPIKSVGDPWYSATDEGEGLEVIEGERRKG